MLNLVGYKTTDWVRVVTDRQRFKAVRPLTLEGLGELGPIGGLFGFSSLRGKPDLSLTPWALACKREH